MKILDNVKKFLFTNRTIIKRIFLRIKKALIFIAKVLIRILCWAIYLKEFKHVFALVSIILSIPIFIFFQVNQRIDYVWIYLLLVEATLVLIVTMSRNIRNQVKEIRPWGFLRTIVRFILAMIIYIVVFASFFSQITSYQDGHFLSDRDFSYKHLKEWDYLYISAMNFLSMESGYVPEGFMKLAIFLEAFLSQIIILTFVFIMFERLIRSYQKGM